MAGTTQWTAERALVAARDSDLAGYAWQTESGASDPIAHQFPRSGPWLNSRCGVRWTLRWWPTREWEPRCPECSDMSEEAIAREQRAILAVAAREAVAP